MHSLFMRLFILVAIAIAAMTAMKTHAGAPGDQKETGQCPVLRV